MIGGPVWGQSASTTTDTTITPAMPTPLKHSQAPASDANSLKGLSLGSALPVTDWARLSDAQRLALKPLATSWPGLSDLHKKKWLTLAANFTQLSSAEQEKLHDRMALWVALSPRQRETARLNFAESRQIAPDTVQQKWIAYQGLSAEEKMRLTQAAPPIPPRTAIAAKPASSSQIRRLPAKALPNRRPPEPAASSAVARHDHHQVSDASLPTDQEAVPANAPASHATP